MSLAMFWCYLLSSLGLRFCSWGLSSFSSGNGGSAFVRYLGLGRAMLCKSKWRLSERRCAKVNSVKDVKIN